MDDIYKDIAEKHQERAAEQQTQATQSYEAIWKILGMLPKEGPNSVDNKGNFITLCHAHSDTEPSVQLDAEPTGKDKTKFASGRCWRCQNTIGNITPERMLLLEYMHGEKDDTKQWKISKTLINKIQKTKTLVEENAPLIAMHPRSSDYDLVKQEVLAILNEDQLNEKNPNWEEVLQSMVDNGDLYVTRYNKFDKKWHLSFAVGYGEDFHIGEIMYHPTVVDKDGKQKKTGKTTGTQNGHFMPFYFQGEIDFAKNPNKSFRPNLLANPMHKVIIVEGQKDMLALRLLNIPAITITGGAQDLTRVPEMFFNKEVYIVYDNDKAGYEGAERLGTQLAEFASSVHIAVDFYRDLEEKEDAYDFLFKYDRSPDEWFSKLANPDNFKTLDLDKLAELKKQAEKDAYSLHLKRKAKKVNSFFDTYDLGMHELIELNAKLDSFEPKASHNIYTKPTYKITNIAQGEDRMAVDNTWKRVKEHINKAVRYDKVNRFELLDESERHFTISTTLTEDDMDIIEKILLATDKKSEQAYRDVFRFFDATIKTIIKPHKDFIKVTIDYDKNEAVDYTQMWVSQDRDFEELAQSEGVDPQVYSVLMPSSEIKSGSVTGDNLTIIAGKLKRAKDNSPFLLGFAMEYRDPIANFELTEEKIKALESFKYKGDTYEGLQNHMRDLYYGMRLEGPEVQIYSKTVWEIIELAYSSARAYMSEDIQGNRHRTRGVLDVAIVGDSGTGKSETIKKFVRVYGTGVKQEFSQATERGLVGGSDTGNSNKVVPGILPQNDKGLVVFEELSGLPSAEQRRDIFKVLLELRSSGSTLISRVRDKVKVNADVRLITTSNPIDNHGEATGLEMYKGTSFWSAMTMLVPDRASLNRFSLVHFATSDEMNEAPQYREIIEHFGGQSPFKTEDYRIKLQWIWSRRDEHVIVSSDLNGYLHDEIKKRILPVFEVPKKEVGFYSAGRTSNHIMRMAIAYAMATISTVDFERVIVKKMHIDAAIDFMLRVYNEETGIPRLVQTIRKEVEASKSEIDIILGKEPIDNVNDIFNSLLTFAPTVPTKVKQLLYDMYKELYGYVTTEDGARIEWNVIKTYFSSISIVSQKAILDDKGEMAMGAWKMAMKKLGMIKENPRNSRQFIIQPKFLDVFTKIQMERSKNPEEEW